MKNVLRPLFVTSSLEYGGAEKHTITLMNRLGERGHDCHTVFLKDERSQIDRVRTFNGGTVRCLAAACYLDVRALARFVRLLANIRPTCIVAANGYSLMYSILAKALARLSVPVLVTYHSTRPIGLKERVQLLAYRPFFWAANCAIFVCDTQRRHCVRSGVLARRNEVIYNGVDTEEFRDSAGGDRTAVRKALGFSPADFVIGMTAALRPEKNHVQLVEAVAALRERGIAARALLIGDGEMRAAIQARARELDVGEDVVIVGFQADVRPYVLACDVIALCSWTEALSLSAIEAMALQRPVVHSAVGGAAEIISTGQNGFLFPVNDTRALVDRLAVLANPHVSRRMGREARRVVEEDFTERIMIDRYERVLVELGSPT